MRFPVPKNAGLLIFALVNFVFTVKYGTRITPHFVLLGLLMVLFYAAIWYRRATIGRMMAKHISAYVLVGAFCVASGVALFKIPVTSLDVDRWDIIASFWKNYFNGDYVYYAKSFDNNYPGPMPFYFILALPFYLMGELGGFGLVGIVVWALLLKKGYSSYAVVLLMALSVGYLWEVCTRSNIFTNAVLILASMVYFLKKYDGSVRLAVWFGMVIGLLLSTRNVFVIPYIILFVYALRKQRISLANLFVLGGVAVVVFVLTFVPFVIGHLRDFAQVNPFVIQSSVLMPLHFTVVFVALAFVLAFFCKEEQDIFYYAALVLLLTILGYFGHLLLSWDWKRLLFDSIADISYLILCVPFALYHLYLTHDTGGNLEK